MVSNSYFFNYQIINSENAEMEWRNGISGAIKDKLDSEAEEVDRQRKKLMREFYYINEETEKKTNQQPKDKSWGWRIIVSLWTWLVIIILAGLLVWRKLRSYW